MNKEALLNIVKITDNCTWTHMYIYINMQEWSLKESSVADNSCTWTSVSGIKLALLEKVTQASLKLRS